MGPIPKSIKYNKSQSNADTFPTVIVQLLIDWQLALNILVYIYMYTIIAAMF